MLKKIGLFALTVACVAGCSAPKTTLPSSVYQNTITLNDGNKMPQLGIGTFNDGSDENARQAVLHALQNGVRMIDTAHAYQDERGVGQAITDSKIPREEIWITSKLWPTEYGEGKTLEAIDKMLARLQTTYIDLLFVHQPVGDYVGAWKDMEKAVKQGKVRSLGISNFEYYGFDEIMQAATIKPAVLQVECHPYFHQTEVLPKIAAHNIKLECWFPLGGAGDGNKTLFNDPVIVRIAKAHNKSAAQVILRWHMQRGHITMPGSIVPWQISENINIGDFELTDAEMKDINELGKKNHRFFTPRPPKELEQFIMQWPIAD